MPVNGVRKQKIWEIVCPSPFETKLKKGSNKRSKKGHRCCIKEQDIYYPRGEKPWIRRCGVVLCSSTVCGVGARRPHGSRTVAEVARRCASSQIFFLRVLTNALLGKANKTDLLCDPPGPPKNPTSKGSPPKKTNT